MRVRSISVSLIIPLMTLCMLIGFNLLPPLMAHAASKPRPEPAKDSLQILPKKQATQSTIPANTISLYESTTNAVTMYNQGCRAAHAAPGLIILDWCQPVYLGNNIYGTYDFGGHDDSDTSILHAVANYAHGVCDCSLSSSTIDI